MTPSSPQRNALAWRALLALLLTAGFYAMALVITAVCWALVYWIVTSANRVPAQLVVLLGATPLALLWSLLPRRDKFIAPGSKLDPRQQPRLFEMITAVARETRQAPPTEVYLISDVNAFVAERGGVLGIGSKRIMGVGLPLLQALTISQFRGVLAHEYGHFQGGDTKLAGWIYKARSAMARAINGVGGIFQAPFIWYGNLFLRVTYGISRQQEFAADRLAAEVVGSATMSAALRETARLGGAFQVYWRSELAPLLREGYRLPIMSGFRQFLDLPETQHMIKESADGAPQAQPDPYDTHPPMAERIAAIHALNIQRIEQTPDHAITLVNNVAALEESLLIDALGADAAKTLKPLTWQNAAHAYQTRFERVVQSFRPALSGMSTDDVFAFIAAPLANFVNTARTFTHNPLLTSIDARSVACSVAGDALSLVLMREGWQMLDVLGKAIRFQKGDHVIEPFSLTQQAYTNELTRAEWIARLKSFGLSGLQLVSP